MMRLVAEDKREDSKYPIKTTIVSVNGWYNRHVQSVEWFKDPRKRHSCCGCKTTTCLSLSLLAFYLSSYALLLFALLLLFSALLYVWVRSFCFGTEILAQSKISASLVVKTKSITFGDWEVNSAFLWRSLTYLFFRFHSRDGFCKFLCRIGPLHLFMICKFKMDNIYWEGFVILNHQWLFLYQIKKA